MSITNEQEINLEHNKNNHYFASDISLWIHIFKVTNGSLKKLH